MHGGDDTNLLMLFMKSVALYCAMDTKYIRTMSGQNSDNLNVKAGGHCDVSGV
jgi:hypothetical protein